MKTEFEWNDRKNKLNWEKHGIHFEFAQYVFSDKNRVILEDIEHSATNEKRYYCLGKVTDKILTVRFTFRENKIRIIGAGFWRKGKKIYEEQNKLHK